MAKLKLSAPWVIFYHEIEAMFEHDSSVHVIYDEDKNLVKLYVDDPDEADALDQILVNSKDFGAVTMNVEVIPANTKDGVQLDFNPNDIYERAFKNNPALSYVKTVDGIFNNPMTYVVFMNCVVQYFNDDLGDVNGLCSTLYQEIAKNIFVQQEGVFYCTDVAFEGGEPIRKWP